ncbi:MAG: Gfo/Idh/MocA family oxidoreductase [Halopseudomonas sp.]
MNRSTYLIVGYGSIGKRHLQNLRRLQPGARIIVLRQSIPVDASTPVPDGADEVLGELGAALQRQPSAAIICSPSPYHTEVARQLVDVGVHLLIEKPISNHLDGVEALATLCDQRKLILMTAYNFRFSDSCTLFRQRLLDGEIGRILSASVDTGQYLPDWRPDSDYREGVSAQRKLGGGALLELSHEFDYLNWLLGEALTVYALVRNTGTLDLDVEDCADLLITYPHGVVASVHIDFLQRQPHRCCKVIGTDGTLIWNAITQEITLIRPELPAPVISSPTSNQRNDMYLQELEHFLDCVAGRDQLQVTGWDGIAALKIAQAAQQSSESSRAVSITEL